MNAMLIDLHVRTNADDLSTTIDGLTEKARAAGIDGVAVIGHDNAPKLPEERPEDLALFAGIEADSDVGRLLCYPRELDQWFCEGGWQDVEKTNGGGPEVYVGAQLVEAFASRGGVVIVAQPYDRDLDHPCAEDAFNKQSGLSGVVVTSSPRHTTSNERAANAARDAKLPGVGGSASTAGGNRFGTVATLFAKPLTDQSTLVDSLKAGRMWPVEIGPEYQGKHKHKEKDKKREEKQAQPEERRKGRKRRRGDDDNRGNRIDLHVARNKPIDNPFDGKQPDTDPIAKLYGMADRNNDPFDRHAHLSDDQLDRVNGNRNKGNDTNVMRPPDFREMRAERQHVNLLLQTIKQDDTADSIALRFAFKALSEASPETLAQVEAEHAKQRRKAATRNRRRRRRK